MIPVAGLLDIEVVPIEFEVIKTDPKLEVVSHTQGRFEVSRSGGEYTAVKRDNFDKASFSKPHVYSSSQSSRINFDGQSGHNGLKSRVSQILSDAYKTTASNMQTSRNFKRLAFEYTPETIDFNWVRDEKIMKGTPGTVDFVVTQYPEVLIDYLGGPIYCPASSDPNYVEPEAAV